MQASPIYARYIGYVTTCEQAKKILSGNYMEQEEVLVPTDVLDTLIELSELYLKSCD